MSDDKGAALMLDALPSARTLIADRGYDANWFRQALSARGIEPCIPSKTNRIVPIPHDPALYRQRHKMEIMFGFSQGLAAHPHQIRSVRPCLHVCHRTRRNRHLLVASMSPEPRCELSVGCPFGPDRGS
jgi:transposase